MFIAPRRKEKRIATGRERKRPACNRHERFPVRCKREACAPVWATRSLPLPVPTSLGFLPNAIKIRCRPNENLPVRNCRRRQAVIVQGILSDDFEFWSGF